MAIANPDEDGFSRYVSADELDEDSRFGNGVDWARATSKIANVYNIEIRYDGAKAIGLKLNGLQQNAC